jgi:hypothetical protein
LAKTFFFFWIFLILTGAVGAQEKLLISNEPETLTLPGRVNRFLLNPFDSYRLLYHHQVASGNALIFKVRLINHTERTVTLSANVNTAGPSDDEVFSGQLLMQRFWQSQLRPSLNVLVLPPGSKKILAQQWVRGGRLASGLVELKNIEAQQFLNLEFSAEQASANVDMVSWDISKNITVKRTDGEIETARIFQEETLDCESGTLNVRLGDVPFVFNSQNLPYEGHYGIWHDIRIAVPSSQNIGVSFAPKGGMAGAVLMAHGAVLTFPAQRAGVISAAQNIHPSEKNGKYFLQLAFMPQPGSNYPIELLFTCRGY